MLDTKDPRANLPAIGNDRQRIDLDRLPPGVRLLGPAGSNDPVFGNLVFRCAGDEGSAVLKVYRRRGGAWSERLAGFSQRWIEKKRGVGAARRRETEAAALSAWQASGFDVPRILDRPAPDWIGDASFLWMEDIEGPTLRDALCDRLRTPSERGALVARYASGCGRRHERALERDEPLLIQEHPAAQHVLVSEDRLVTFDLEHAYRPGFPVLTAIAYELSSLLRSFTRLEEGEDAYFDAFARAYGRPWILRESCRLFFGPSIGWRIYRRHEMRHRGQRSKTASMRRLANWVEAST